MNREIKFRIWSKTHNAWISNRIMIDSEGKIWFFPTQQRIEGMINNFELITQQFTGLKDKNGKEIYEGDIINGSGDTSSTQNRRAIIEWNFNGIKCKDIKFDRYIDLFYLTFEVIGNIFENTELLKSQC